MQRPTDSIPRTTTPSGSRRPPALSRGKAPSILPPAPRSKARLTAAMTRYLGDLHYGRVAPDELPHGYALMRSAFDPEAALRRAMEAGRLADAAREAAPRFAQYERLREALAQYRVLADHPAWKSSLPPLPPGDRGSPPKLETGTAVRGRAAAARTPDRPRRPAGFDGDVRDLRRGAGRRRARVPAAPRPDDRRRHRQGDAGAVAGAARRARAAARTDARTPALDAADAGAAHGRDQHPRVRAARVRGPGRAHRRARRR